MSEKPDFTNGRQSRKYLLLPVVIACAALLASCGGGSDSTSTAEPKMEVINGIIVPPEPAPSINNATLAGVDVNANGVRDDVERLIASGTSSKLLFSNVLTSAIIYQNIITGKISGNENVASEMKKVSCIDIKTPVPGFDQKAIALLVANNDSRRNVMRRIIADAPLYIINTSVDCK